MNKRKILKHFLLVSFIVATIVFIIWIINKTISVADVGSFESYSGGGGSSYSGGGSSYSSGGHSSYSGGGHSSYSSGGHSSYSSGSNSDLDETMDKVFGTMIIIFTILFISYGIIEHKKKSNVKYVGVEDFATKDYSTYLDEDKIIASIKANNPNFNANNFELYVSDLFVKLQNAWTERDWEKIRTYETNELFEQHKAQLQGYIDNNQINVMDEITVNWVKIYSYYKESDNELLTVDLNSKMIDYIIDATTKEVVRGDKTTQYINTYRLKFTRTNGTETASTIKCPNCGAPTTVMTSGKCDYCGSIITSENYGWALSSLERLKGL